LAGYRWSRLLFREEENPAQAAFSRAKSLANRETSLIEWCEWNGMEVGARPKAGLKKAK